MKDEVSGVIVDRIEGKLAVVELIKGETRNVPLDLIEGRVRDGAVLVERDGRYVVDEGATAERTARVAEKRKRLFKR